VSGPFLFLSLSAKKILISQEPEVAQRLAAAVWRDLHEFTRPIPPDVTHVTQWYNKYTRYFLPKNHVKSIASDGSNDRVSV